MPLVAEPPKVKDNARARLVAAMATLYVLWSSTYLAIRVGVHGLPPLGMAGVRFLVAGGLMAAYHFARGGRLPPARQLRNAAVVGCFLLVGGNGLVTVGEQWVDSGTAAILVATSSLWTTLFAGLLGIRPRLLEWVGLGVGMAGVVLLNAGDAAWSLNLGTVLVLAAALSWAAGSIVALRVEMPASFVSTAVQMLAAGAVLLAASIVFGERVPADPPPAALAALGYLIVVAVAGFTAYNYALHHARPAVATSYVYVNPVLAVALGAVFLGERVTGYTFGAMALVVLGVLFVVVAKNRR